ncbi:restriction endonuclease subunit S [Micromonospora haikouensis]|uniref:restriction endonuclease subunit S n=1 Tax=Micromonospora haikouensis TaxID=686309 RepID=UPI0034249072
MMWGRARLKDLCVDAGQYGLNISADSYSTTGTRLIRTSDIGADGSLRSEGVFVNVPLQGRFTLKQGDLLLSRSGTLGRSFLTPLAAEGATFAGYLVRFRPSRDVDARFLGYVASSQPFQDAIRADAVSSTIQNFNAERYANIPIDVPSYEEQKRIADFLDAEAARLQRAMELIKKQLQILGSREVSLLQEVTALEGVPNVAVRRVVSRLTSGPRGWGALLADQGVPFIRIANIPRSGINMLMDNLAYVDAPVSAERERTRTRRGDVLVSITADIGSIGIVDGEAIGGNVSQHIALVRPLIGRCLPRWLAYALKAPNANTALTMSSYGGTKVGLGLADVAGTVIPVPPLTQQARLVRRVDEAMEWAADLRGGLRRRKDLLVERWLALVTAVVTGQIEVRTAGESKL